MKKAAIITGGSQGIGEAIAVEVAANGIHAMLVARNVDKLKAVAYRIHAAGGLCSYYPCDVTRSEEIDRTVNAIRQEHGELPQILINNAGSGGPFHATDEVSEEEWDLIFATNVKAAFLFCKKLLPVMKQNNSGRIINISSVYGLAGGAYSSTYAASKHALVGYTRSLAAEWGHANITCNVISPGYVDTAMGVSSNAGLSDGILSRIPAGRQALPDEIARLVYFLIQPENGYINGADIVIDGGLLAGFRFE